MQKLNLPEYSFRKKTENGKESVFDELRKKFVRLTPEEWVRQNFIRFLMTEKNYPASLMAVEAGVNINNNLLRADLIVYGKNGQPTIAVEFKAPSVKISQDTFNQIVRYNMNLKVDYLMVSNGLSHFCCRIDYSTSSYKFLKEIPDYKDIIQTFNIQHSTFMNPRLNIVTLGVSNLKQSRDFYLTALGWETAPGSDDNIVFYNHGGIIFALYPLGKLAEDAMLPPERNGFSGVTLAINLDSKEAVDKLYLQIIENGGKSLVEPRATFWGGYDCYFADPDGHAWEIAWAPFWKYNEQGSLMM